MNRVIKLNTGFDIPLLGFSAYHIHDKERIYETLDYALKAGYRHIDTAAMYDNEEYIGSALKTLLPKYNLKREDIFITSKLISPKDKDQEFIEQMVRQSLAKLQTDYLDLYLIYWGTATRARHQFLEDEKHRKVSWDALCQLKKEGLLRSIGVSNYTLKRLTEMLNDCNGVTPAVNQVEWDDQSELLKFCRQKGIFLQLYPLRESLAIPYMGSFYSNETVADVAARLKEDQVTCRTMAQQNIGILLKARSRRDMALLSNPGII